jgi:hypothetical protein
MVKRVATVTKTNVKLIIAYVSKTVWNVDQSVNAIMKDAKISNIW